MCTHCYDDWSRRMISEISAATPHIRYGEACSKMSESQLDTMVRNIIRDRPDADTVDIGIALYLDGCIVSSDEIDESLERVL